MKKFLNITDRLDLHGACLMGSKIVQKANKTLLVLKWDVKDEDLNPDSQLVADFFVQNTTESRREKLGRVGEGVGEREFDISDMLNPLDVKIRLKVIRYHENIPMIVALIDKFEPESSDNEGGNSLLPIITLDTLNTPWNFEIVQGVPTLYLSGKFNLAGHLKSRSTAEWFFPIIIHHIFREIFIWLASRSSYEDEVKARKWKQLFIDKYGCPANSFEINEDLDEDTRRSEIQVQAQILAEQVSRMNSDLQKLNSYFEFIGKE